ILITTTMITNDENWNQMSPCDFDDLFSFPDNFNPQILFDQYSMLHDDMIENKTLSSSTIHQYQPPALSHNNAGKKSKKSNFECHVCGGPAYGYNFDQITCESCKAFFRRNAFRDMSRLSCRFYGSCVITVTTRRDCTYCRLKKCFDINMRKDWIRTEEEKQSRELIKFSKEHKKTSNPSNDQLSFVTHSTVRGRKKRLMSKSKRQKLIANPIYEINCFGLNHVLDDDDRTLLNNINDAYQLIVANIDYSYIHKYTSSTSLSQFINNESIIHESLINFFKCITEFKQLDINDQIILIKSNFINIIHLHYMLIMDFQESSIISKNMSKWISEDFHYQMIRTHRYLFRFMNYPLLLKLTLIVFIFNVDLSASSDPNQFYEYNNQRILFECQNYYTNILWRYLNYLFDEKEAIQSMYIIVTQILRYQLLMVTMKNSIRQSSDCDQLHSLMKSILGLS
ncbi:unnamed protein product, partial [Rotaria sp. Silwood1]